LSTKTVTLSLKVVPKVSITTSIAILTGASPSWNPRARKEATSLVTAGFRVSVYGASTDVEGLETDQSLARRNGFAYEPISFDSQAVWPRLRGRISRDVYRFAGIESVWQLGTYGPALLLAAHKARADYYIVHLEQASWVGANLLRAGFRVGVDIEDWYSEDLPAAARGRRPLGLLRNVESTLLTQCAHVTCTSAAMSSALSEAYSCRAPAVVYNAFPWADRQSLDGLNKDRVERQLPSIHWVSQTLGRDRGLEDLLAALQLVEHEAEIHLRGHLTAGFKEWLFAHIADDWRNRIWIHPVVSNEELLSRIAEHDIGFAGEMKYCRNKDLTVSNKILHYLLAGLAVIASDTAGQKEVAMQAGNAVLTYPSGDATTLASRLNLLLGSPETLRRAKADALRAAREVFCWERQQPVLLDHIKQAIAG
jgi:glycosyltransferase involved in cell wall biosynthesis